MACVTCKDLRDFRNSALEGFPIHAHNLVKSAQLGCRFCALLYNGCSWYSRWLGHGDADKINFINPKFEHIGAFRATNFNKWGPGESVEFYALPGEIQEYSIIPQRPHIAIDSASDECFSLIRTWIEDCVRSHPQCAVQSPPHLPNKVIDVGRDGDRPRLYITSQEESQYVTLSHCWGMYQIITTTTKTIEQRKTGIEWDQLSKTFQDAIAITRKLGQRYLWIDSLCIVQDDELDWQRESGKMAQIYSDSHFTIAATRSADGTGGCFSQRNPHSEELSGILDDTLRQNLTGIYVRNRLNFHRTSTYLQNDREEFPLYFRAWAFQERLLARRVIEYAPEELRWECKAGSKCECGSFDQESQHAQYLRSMLPQTSIKSEYHKSKLGDVDDLKRSWAAIVQIYSQLKLSFPRDRLPALSGVAQDIQHDKKERYLAGIWERDLPQALLWRMEFPGTRTVEYRAPTWSWVSCEAQLDVDLWNPKKYTLTSHVTVLEAACTPLGVDLTGQVRDGYLRISGSSLEPAELFANYSSNEPGFSNPAMSGAVYSIPGISGTFFPDSKVVLEVSGRAAGKTRVSFLRVATRVGKNGKLEETYAVALVCSQRIQGAYERIGLVEQFSSKVVDEFYREARDKILTII